MEDWPDDRLDELFRKSAEEFDIPFNSDDWVDMSRRLDEHDRRSLFDRISRWGGIGALFLLLLAGLEWLTVNADLADKRQLAGGTKQMPVDGIVTASLIKKVENESITKEVRPQENRLTKVIPANVPDKKLNGPEGDVDKIVPNTNAPARQETTKIDNRQASVRVAWYAPKRKKQPIDQPNEPARFVSKTAVFQPEPAVLGTSPVSATANRTRPVALTGNTSETANRKQPATSTGNTFETANRTRPATSAGNVPDPEMNGTLTVNSPLQTAVPQPEAEVDGRWLPGVAPATSLTALVEQQVRPFPEPMLRETEVSLPARQVTPRLSGLSIILLASPDLSGIGLINFERPGSNAGLAVQYQITNRLSVNVGAMYSTKRYHTASSNYVWPANMKMEVWPSVIAGVCKMIDVPLNVRYDWLLRPRSGGRAPTRWFATTGLTSYFIQREVYSYEYANPDDPRIKARGWDNQKAGRPGGSFRFSNLNISVGYEQSITHRLSWQVEPFVKVPLQEVGYFQVKLLSTGVLVGVRYSL